MSAPITLPQRVPPPEECPAPRSITLRSSASCQGGPDLRLLVERRASIAHNLLHRRLVADPESVRTRLSNEVRPVLERKGRVVDGRRIQLGLAECEHR
jgi:hypothetical protein